MNQITTGRSHDIATGDVLVAYSSDGQSYKGVPFKVSDKPGLFTLTVVSLKWYERLWLYIRGKINGWLDMK